MTQSSSPVSRRSCLTKGLLLLVKTAQYIPKYRHFYIDRTLGPDLQFLYINVHVRILVPNFKRVQCQCTFSFFLIHARIDLFKEWDIPKLQLNFRYFTYAIYMKIFAFWCSNLNKFVFRELVCRDGNGKCIFDFPP